MTGIRKSLFTAAAATLFAATPALVFAQAIGEQTPGTTPGASNSSSPSTQQSSGQATITGCLTKDTSGNYVITDDSGVKTTVTGSADLEKDSANHRVMITGTQSAGTTGAPTFQASKVQQIATTCTK
jgi:hypothetical protein